MSNLGDRVASMHLEGAAGYPGAEIRHFRSLSPR